jgi:nucleolar GTP-binding protein
MNFQDLRNIENPDFYLDIAFRRAKERVEVHRGRIACKSQIDKSQQVEIYKLKVISDTLVSQLEKIIKSFPSIDSLPDFYRELVKVTLDYEELKKSLGGVNWAREKVGHFFRIYQANIARCQDLQKINAYRREFYGRVSSLLKQIKDELATIEKARKIMKGYPNVKTSLPTIAIAGFPNVGKTTLLSKLTGSKPDIQPYAFTTREINIGYLKVDDKRIQFLDTPGTLDRFEKMNNIEKQAYLAIKLCAEKIIYVFDLTEASFPIEQQIALYENTKKFDKPIICYLSKTDMMEKGKADAFKKKYHCITDMDELKKEVSKIV